MVIDRRPVGKSRLATIFVDPHKIPNPKGYTDCGNRAGGKLKQVRAGSLRARPVLAGGGVMCIYVHMMTMVMVTMIKHDMLMAICDGVVMQIRMIKAMSNEKTNAILTISMMMPWHDKTHSD